MFAGVMAATFRLCPYSTHEPCAMCPGLRVVQNWRGRLRSSQEDIDAYAAARNEVYIMRGMPDLLPVCFQEGNHHIPVIGSFLRNDAKNCSATGVT